ncbi:CAMK/CAMK1 protein kinase Srk1 [Schizosaccharomyces japonicus yFS275]|uniref:CAMK/CAMK1 protein kinase Srk1 n=1 Tax=Schizosaccharomyces japonicus (strain yFS275 / FY16936) TaxID=402676 RepID=B6JXF7_SCHJY|nr:CAMK/CAMK1 protein kinase Srk1 [Schizosaccharomyces japonicus yFS275]EEB06058.1 CAMK/CAMK1 protein kinase Srk1 [Schizosaccharomyces japonicus yFS275]
MLILDKNGERITDLNITKEMKDPKTVKFYDETGEHAVSESVTSADVDEVTDHAASEVPKEHNRVAYDKAIEDMVEKIVLEESSGRHFPELPGLENFHLLEQMGDGAFSIVYKAVNIKTGEKVAIKVIHKMLKSEDGTWKPSGVDPASILKEVQIMRRLKHPNIIQLLDFIQTEQHFFLILELADGGELFHQIVRLTYFSEDLSRHVIKQVAEAIRYLHEECGVVHRDIKPENLLFDRIDFVKSRVRRFRKGDDESKEDEGEFIPGVGAGTIGRIRLADFGLSKVVWDSHTKTPCGTMGYTAPEIVQDQTYSKSVDMWALGCVLYTILCGFPPFYDESIPALTKKVSQGQYTFLSPWWDDISKGAQDLISHLLTVDPKSRYDIHQFLAHPWIVGTEEPTFPASDAPPTGKPESAFEFDLMTPTDVQAATVRTPGVTSLREVFNISYAAHRMEIEKNRRKVIKQNYANFFNDLDDLDEGDEEFNSSNSTVIEESVLSDGDGGHRISTKATVSPIACQRKRRETSHRAFDLNINNSTLFTRRHRNAVH